MTACSYCRALLRGGPYDGRELSQVSDTDHNVYVPVAVNAAGYDGAWQPAMPAEHYRWDGSAVAGRRVFKYMGTAGVTPMAGGGSGDPASDARPATGGPGK